MLRHFELVISAVVGSSSLSSEQSSVPANLFVSFQVMPLKIIPSKRPLPVAKRSSLRNCSYEVEPIPGRKVYPSREYPSEYQQPIRPPPLSDQEAAAFHTSRSVSRYDPAQSPLEIAPVNSLSGGEIISNLNPSILIGAILFLMISVSLIVGSSKKASE